MDGQVVSGDVQNVTPSDDQMIAKVLVKEGDHVTKGTPCLLYTSSMNIAVAGTGYVGLSIATLLAQHNKVTAVDIIPEKVELIRQKKSPIQDDYIEKYLAEKKLDLTATLDVYKRQAEIW